MQNYIDILPGLHKEKYTNLEPLSKDLVLKENLLMKDSNNLLHRTNSELLCYHSRA